MLHTNEPQTLDSKSIPSGKGDFFTSTYPMFCCSMLLKLGSVNSKAFNKNFELLCKNNDLLCDFLLKIKSSQLRSILKRADSFDDPEHPKTIHSHLKEVFLDALKDQTGSKNLLAQKITSILQESDVIIRPIEKRVHNITQNSALIYLPPDITPNQLDLNNFDEVQKLSLSGFYNKGVFREYDSESGVTLQQFINALIPSSSQTPKIATIEFSENGPCLLIRRYKKHLNEGEQPSKELLG